MKEKIINHLKTGWMEMSKNYSTYLIILGVMIGGMIALFLINAGFGHSSARFFNLYPPTLGQLMTSRVVYMLLAYLVGIAFFAYTQSLFTQTALGAKNFREAHEKTKSHYQKFLKLSLLILIVSSLAFLPLFGLTITFFLDLPLRSMFLALTGLIQLLVMMAVAVWMVWLPYVMLDKKLGLRETLRTTTKLVSGKFVTILLHILTLIALYILAQIIIFPLRIVIGDLAATIFNLAFVFVGVPFTYSYFAQTYKSFN